MSSERVAEARRELETAGLAFEVMRRRAGNVGGWIRAVRKAVGVPVEELAERMGIGEREIYRMESREKDGRIRVGRLRQAAEAMDCALIYALVPRTSTLDGLAAREKAAKKKARELKWLKKRLKKGRVPGATSGADALRHAAWLLLRRVGIRVGGRRQGSAGSGQGSEGTKKDWWVRAFEGGRKKLRGDSR
ncbi:MAG: helix-turn-helix domain-containing protein [Terracidiphilus sp.]